MKKIKRATIPFNHPFMMTISGPSQSGKTYLIAKILENADELISPPPTKLVYAYSCWQTLYNDIIDNIEKNKDSSSLQSYEFIDCSVKPIPDIEKLQTGRDNLLLVLDDLMVNTTSSKVHLSSLNQLAVRDSHHHSVSVIYVCQNLNYGEGKLRTVKLNSKYQIVFNNYADLTNLEMVCQNRKIPKEKMMELLNEIRSRGRYGYVLFDNCPKSYDNARVRTGILPEDDTDVYDNMLGLV